MPGFFKKETFVRMDGKEITARTVNMESCTGEEDPQERDMMLEKKDEVSFRMIFYRD